MDDPLAKLNNGTLNLYALDKELPPKEAVRVRRAYIEDETGADLAALGTFSIGIDRVVKRNIENMIGAVQVPVGVAGPLKVMGEYANGTYWLPLTTTEGALVARRSRLLGDHECAEATPATHRGQHDPRPGRVHISTE